MSSLSAWNPISCSLQLLFSPPTSGPSAIRTGSTYQGTSVIRYRREKLPTDAHEALSSSPLSSSEYTDFLQHRRAIAAKHALHLHALTSAGGLYKDARPLQVSNYQVSCVSSPASGQTGARKVVSVEQEDAHAATSTAGKKATNGAAEAITPDKKGKGKAKGSKKSGGGGGGAPATAAGAEETDGGEAHIASVDWGSKLVLFEGAASLPLYSEVELTVQFVGTVQAFDHGGIYAARSETSGSGGGATSTEDAPLLTHLEVRFARCAFPCPDDPQYRLDWQLKSLQLPDTYTTVLTNGEEIGCKTMAAQRAVQRSFGPCGPLPAYTFAFACFPETLQQVEGALHIADFTSSALEENGYNPGSDGAESCLDIPVRVLARCAARIPVSTLERVLRITREAVAALQEVFHCPFPLLQCRHVDVLLGPTMPFISGMEHHCSIILNETVYQPGKKTAGGGGGNASNAETEQTELIVHELAHHWVGNALGLPFAVKEGICQVLEQCIGDTLLGKPMRKFKPDSAAPAGTVTTTGAAGSSEVGVSGATTSTATTTTTTIQASEKGHEFTGTSYQHALSAIKRLVADRGFDAFEVCLQQLVRECIVEPFVSLEEQGGAQTLRLIGAEVPPPPYLSTEAFLEYMGSAA